MEPLTNPFVPPQIAPAPKWGPSVYVGAGLAGLAQGLAQGMKEGEDVELMRKRNDLTQQRQDNQQKWLHDLFPMRQQASNDRHQTAMDNHNNNPALKAAETNKNAEQAALDAYRLTHPINNGVALPGITGSGTSVGSVPSPVVGPSSANSVQLTPAQQLFLQSQGWTTPK